MFNFNLLLRECYVIVSYSKHCNESFLLVITVFEAVSNFKNSSNFISMNPKRPYRKFSPQQKQIQALEQKSDRFRRVYSEYEMLSDELWNLENSDTHNIPDDFVDAVKIQTEYLEEEISGWLMPNANSELTRATVQ